MRVRLHYVYNVLVGVCETISAKYLRDKIAEEGWERIAVGCQEWGRGGGVRNIGYRRLERSKRNKLYVTYIISIVGKRE